MSCAKNPPGILIQVFLRRKKKGEKKNHSFPQSRLTISAAIDFKY